MAAICINTSRLRVITAPFRPAVNVIVTKKPKSKPVKALAPLRILTQIAANIQDQAVSRQALKQIDVIHRRLLALSRLIDV